MDNSKVVEEMISLNRALDKFTAAMKERLMEKLLEQGYHGWDQPENFTAILNTLSKKALNNEGEEIDIANLAMFLWYQRNYPEHGAK